jgi:hypothetical protein
MFEVAAALLDNHKAYVAMMRVTTRMACVRGHCGGPLNQQRPDESDWITGGR